MQDSSSCCGIVIKTMTKFRTLDDRFGQMWVINLSLSLSQPDYQFQITSQVAAIIGAHILQKAVGKKLHHRPLYILVHKRPHCTVSYKYWWFLHVQYAKWSIKTPHVEGFCKP
jgi:hypothetical protein